MVAAELAVGVPGDPVKQQLALDVAGRAGLVEERSGQPAGAVHHRLAEKPLEGLQHGSVLVGKTRSARDRAPWRWGRAWANRPAVPARRNTGT